MVIVLSISAHTDILTMLLYIHISIKFVEWLIKYTFTEISNIHWLKKFGAKIIRKKKSFLDAYFQLFKFESFEINKEKENSLRLNLLSWVTLARTI